MRADISHFYSLKTVIEQLLGKEAWLDLKEATSLTKWRVYVLKLIAVIRVSIKESVQIVDQAWLDAVRDNLDDGKASAKAAKTIDELLSGFAATLLRQVFLQIGMLPNRTTARRVTLSRQYWRLDSHRSVQYVQTPQQIEAAFWSVQQRQLGFERQMELRDEYRASRSKLPYWRWCQEKEGYRGNE
ncbi:hypothetical protein [Desulfococcus multivorans]|uniref:Uncharacterized protein n=1 Tax=Desulfococcus multivorans DSM 2059 TaxID=1121405 RepID=S7UFC3_DESML|nr:hypothetical protein [Desulfococcus multivorans]AQV02586.1 hypothetical protein B2D07_18605 [Desulfococcus multivorans]EPR32509.1 hypothetical protein dsmv_0882 [Desulfococcus multivorans DSM 2059]SKA27682.1 hypothetical protein SAMN02745446_03717 [Desulfococcus multivorans DSM 2059]